MSEPPGRSAAREGSAARVVRNTLIYALGNGAGIIVTIFLTPLLIGELGASTYGVWALATSLSFGLGYLSLADLGIEDAAVRFIAQARAAGLPERVRAFVSSAVAVLGAVALVLTPLLVLASGWLVDLFSIPAEDHADALIAFRLVALQLLFDLPARAFSALLQGAQDYGRWQVVEFARAVLTAVALAGAVLAGTGIVGMAVASLAVSVVLFVATAAVALTTVPSARPSPRAVDRATLRQMAGFSGQLTIFRLTGVVYRQTDRTIIGIALSASAVTTYEIANRIQTAAALVATITTAAVAPAAAFHSASRERLRELLVRGTRLSLAASLPVVIAAGAFAEPLVRTWIGDDYADAAGPTRLFLIVVLLSAFVGLGQSVLVGMGRVKGMLWIGVAWLAINLPVSIALAGPLGVEGVILGTVASQALTFPPLVWVLSRAVGVRASTWLRGIVLPNVPGVVAQAALCVLLVPVASRSGSLVVTVLLAAATVAVAVAGFVGLGVGRAEREDLIATVGHALGRRPAPDPPSADEPLEVS